MAKADLILTASELESLVKYAETQSKHCTFHLQRDTGNRLYVHEPNGKLTQIEAAR